MSRLIAVILGLLLAACVAKTSGLPQGAYRNTATPIYSSAVFDAARLPGRWKQVAGFGVHQGCSPGGVEIRRGLKASFRLCLSGQEIKGSGQMVAAGPGRFQVAGQEWWIVWADGDYRTMAIGTPSGAFGFVLNRDGAISADRLNAAREILDWNGYDLGQFHSFAG
jgi:apolipoprotein D and lipocalin family protein